MISNLALSTPPNENLYNDNSAGNAVNSIKAAPSTLFWLTCDNTQNSTTSTHIRVWNQVAGNITNGTTPSDIVLFIPANTIVTYNLGTAAQPGLSLSVALSVSAVQEAGQVGATSPPHATVITASYI